MDNNKKDILEHKELGNVSGGWDGQYEWVGSFNCPYCGASNIVNQYCYRGQTPWTCQKCGRTFTI